MADDANAAQQSLTDYYDRKIEEAKSGAGSDWPQLKQALTDCVLELAFADFGEGEGALHQAGRTRGLLRFLDYYKNGWSADEAHVARLLALGKRARQFNRDDSAFVLDLDRAIANRAIEGGRSGLKRIIAVDTEKSYPENVERKIAELGAAMGDYAGGPLQVLVHDLLAVAFEESAMIAAGNGEEAAALQRAREAIGELDKALATMADPAVVNRPDIEFFHNDFRFRKAFLLRLIDGADWQAPLKEIVETSPTWEETDKLDHIYVRSFVRWPQQDPYVKGTAPGSVRVSLPKNAFYNPGQIALYLCGWQPPPGGAISERAQALDNHLDVFVNRDYRVVIRASRDVSDRRRDMLAKLAAETNAQLKGKWRDLMASLEKLSPGISKGETAWEIAVKRGARQCGVSNDVRDRVFSGFEPEVRGTWRGRSKAPRAFGIYVGGFLSRTEAQLLVQSIQAILGQKDEPFVARPKING